MSMTVASVVGPLAGIWAQVPPGDYDPSSGHGPEWGKAAPIGLLIWLLLGLALYLLIRSLNRHLRKVPASFDGAADHAERAGAQHASETGGAAGPAAKPAGEAGDPSAVSAAGGDGVHDEPDRPGAAG